MNAANEGQQTHIPLALLALVPVLAYVVGVAALPRLMAMSEARAQASKAVGEQVVRRTPPAPSARAKVSLGDGAVTFLGADLPSTPIPAGDQLELALHFQVHSPIDRNWQVFMHIDSGTDTFRIHGDHVPAMGKLPTTLWEPGTYVIDRYSRGVPSNAPAGVYQVWAGLYIGNERMAVDADDTAATDGDDRIRVGTITVK